MCESSTYDRELTTCSGALPKIRQRSEIEDCGQDGVCRLSPGCNRHWEERNRELVCERDAAIARAEQAERERDELRERYALVTRKVLPPGVEVVPIPPEPKFQPFTIDPHAWTVIDSYERADGSRTWRAMGPWRATRKEAERDAEHGSMLGALPELSASEVQRVRALERERDAALARVAELEEALREIAAISTGSRCGRSATRAGA